MAFQQVKLSRSINQTRGIFDKYIYSPSNNDTLDDIISDGYFTESRYGKDDDWVGSIIEISTPNEYAIVKVIPGDGVEVLFGSNKEASSIRIERLIDMESTDETQFPTGVGVSNYIVVNYGTGQGGVEDPVSVSSLGVLTINETGLYRLKVALQYGRQGNPGTSRVLFGAFVGGFQVGRSVAVTIPDQNSDSYVENDNWVNLTAGTQVEYRLMRDSDGGDSGGLVRFKPTIDGGSEWNESPCAALRVERLINA